jgi:transcriptional antiterminator NusG
VSDTESKKELSQPEYGAGTSAPEVPAERPGGAEAPEEQAVEEQPAEPEAVEEPVAEEQAVEEQTAEEPVEPQAPPRLAFPDMDWYIIHTYSGFENKVKESLRTRADAFGFGDRIGEILIPTEDVVEMRSGKKVRTKRLLYPGYVLVQLQMDDELWHVVRNTPRVTSFVGSGQTPTPLTADEVNQILYRQTASVEKPRPRMTFEKNDRVKIVDGPFSNFAGTVEEVNEDRSTLKVMVTIFGRGTPVELEYFQVEKEKV